MSLIQLIGRYRVKEIMKKSKARYAVGIEENDEIKFVMTMVNTTGASNGGNYVLYADLYVNGKLKTNISQNEFTKITKIMELESLENCERSHENEINKQYVSYSK